MFLKISEIFLAFIIYFALQRKLNFSWNSKISPLSENVGLPSIRPSLKTPKSEYPTCIKSRNLIPPKSNFTERHFTRRSENPKSYSPKLSLLRSTVPPKVPSPGKSRKCHCSEFLFFRCPSYIEIDVLLTNERQKAN